MVTIRTISVVAGVLVFIAALAGIWWWGMQYYEETIVDIAASHDIPELGRPVYAQFIVAQTIWLEREVSAIRLEVPLYIPDWNKPFIISLLSGGQEIRRWDLREVTQKEGLQVVGLVIDPPLLLDGGIEVIFDGSNISHDDETAAPRVFVESDDKAYPSGHYIVGGNNKEGDVSLSIVGRSENWVRWRKVILERPLFAVEMVLRFGLVLVVIATLPLVVIKSLARNGRGGSD